MDNKNMPKIDKVYVEDYELQVDDKYEKEGKPYYSCTIVRHGTYDRVESISLSEEEILYLMRVANCSSIEELKGININTLVMILQGSFMRFPIFLGVGYEGIFVLLEAAKRYYKEDEFHRLTSLETLDTKLNVRKVVDYRAPRVSKTK